LFAEVPGVVVAVDPAAAVVGLAAVVVLELDFELLLHAAARRPTAIPTAAMVYLLLGTARCSLWVGLKSVSSGLGGGPIRASHR
jgi:hypothetical protein